MTGHKKYIQFSGNMVQSPLKMFKHIHEADNNLARLEGKL